MRVLDLFSGIGGFSLGLTRAGMRTTAFCEIEEYPRSILRRHWPDVPIFSDVRKLHATDLPEAVDLICGGYPCQPFSVAGKRQGQDDDRHLWPEIVRLIRELDATTGKPTWCIFENVAGHVSMGLDQVLLDLEAEGYAAWPFIVPACAVNAPHRRDRVWIVAHASRQLLNRSGNTREAGRHEFTDCGFIPANSSGTGRQKRNISAITNQPGHGAGGGNADDVTDTESQQAGGVFKPWFSTDLGADGDWRGQAGEWITLPGVRARNDGLSQRVARLKALGNAVVPQIPEIIGRAIMEMAT